MGALFLKKQQRGFYLALVSMLLVSCGESQVSTIAPATVGETSKTFGDYTVHYSAFTSDTLQPGVARAYKVTRSKNRGLLSISIVNHAAAPLGKSVKARVTAKAINLTGQLKEIVMREVEEASAIYYLSEFQVAHQEVLDFSVQIHPEGLEKSYSVRFRKQFYTQ